MAAEPVWAIGLMSGTSLDGVDAAVLLTDGVAIAAFGPVSALGYSQSQGRALRAALDWAEAHYPTHFKLTRKIDLWDIEAFREAEAVLDETHRAAIAQLGVTASPASTPRLVGFHGQTVLHRPEDAYTLQIGDAALLSEIGLPVVHDFRSADMVAGGEGAPLAPFFHHACARWAGLSEPVAFLNIGGVANVTWLDPSIDDPVEACLAFDTGPGNALIDDWMRARAGASCDLGGAMAASGRPHAIPSNAAQAYLDRAPPKSLDRNEFAAVLKALDGLSIADGAATLTRFTVQCVAASQAHMPAPPSRWLVCGGGRHNATIMRLLEETLEAPVMPVEEIGLDGDFLEAQAFAYLAVRVLRGLPTSAPRTTGCSAPVCGGRISGGSQRSPSATRRSWT